MQNLEQRICNNRKVCIFAVPNRDISIADVMELVDMLDLGSSASRRAGSIPVIRTKKVLQ